MSQRWEKIPGYDRYEVSDDGEVRTCYKCYKGITKKRKIEIDRAGYPTVRLSQDGKIKNHFVHRLVATAFVPNPDKKPVVNHKDGNRQNNHFTNLEWCTMAENVLHGWRVLGRTSGGPKRKKVICVETQKMYPNLYAAAQAVGGSPGHICQCCKGTRNVHKGFHWNYAEGNKEGLCN